MGQDGASRERGRHGGLLQKGNLRCARARTHACLSQESHNVCVCMCVREQVGEVRTLLDDVTQQAEEVKTRHSIIVSAPNPDSSKSLVGAPLSVHMVTMMMMMMKTSSRRQTNDSTAFNKHTWPSAANS